VRDLVRVTLTCGEPGDQAPGGAGECQVVGRISELHFVTTRTLKVPTPAGGGEIVHLEDRPGELGQRTDQSPLPLSRLASVPRCMDAVPRCMDALASCRASDVTRRPYVLRPRGVSRRPGRGGKMGTDHTARAEGGPCEQGHRSLGSRCGRRVQSACQSYREDVPLQ
jgi:hypothetical protein